MSDTTTFVVDACSWICMHEERYSPDLFPQLWTHLRPLAEQGRLKSPREVVREVREEDGVGAWIRTIKPSMVPPVTPRIKTHLQDIVRDYPKLVEDYTSNADPWLIAFAVEHGWTLVTEEKPSLGGGRPKIPNVCVALKVDFVDCTEMIRRLGIRWGAPAVGTSARREK